MLQRRTLIERDGVRILDVACRHPRGRGETLEHASAHAIVFVRRGCFVRTVNGKSSLLDTTVAYCENPGEEHRYDHPHSDGDDCTALLLDPGLLGSLRGDEPALPAGPLRTSPRIDLAARALLAAGRRGDPDELVERAITLAGAALEHADPRPLSACRPATARAHRALADEAREALGADPGRSLVALARELASSPFHLSRTFHAVTGQTISRHRLRLRTRGALERLAGGERNLGRLAAELGFADHSHLCRVIRAETGQTPTSLRRLLDQ